MPLVEAIPIQLQTELQIVAMVATEHLKKILALAGLVS
jgi:hypothetical protein